MEHRTWDGNSDSQKKPKVQDECHLDHCIEFLKSGTSAHSIEAILCETYV